MANFAESVGRVSVFVSILGGMVAFWCLVPALPCFLEPSPGILIPAAWRPYGAVAGLAVAAAGFLVAAVASRWARP